MSAIFDELTRLINSAVGDYNHQRLDECITHLEKAEKEIRELKRMAYLSNRVSGLPTGQSG